MRARARRQFERSFSGMPMNRAGDATDSAVDDFVTGGDAGSIYFSLVAEIVGHNRLKACLYVSPSDWLKTRGQAIRPDHTHLPCCTYVGMCGGIVGTFPISVSVVRR